MNRYIMEFIGTFFLVLVVGMASGDLAPLAIGSVLMIMIYAGGHISGGHYNPAVTLGVALRGRSSWADLGAYWIAQILAAIIAAFVVGFFKAGMEAPVPIDHNVPVSLLAEFLFTFALVFVVLNVATSKDTEGNSYFGLAIGFTVLAGAVAVGGLSGGAFNPAVAIGITMMGISAWVDIWIYLVACLLGGAVAGYTFKALNPNDP